MFHGERKTINDKWTPERKRMRQLLFKVPNCPIIPLTLFNFYIREHMGQLKSQIPELSDEAAKDILKERFNNLDIETYSIYEEKNSKEWTEFYYQLEQLMKDYPEYSAVIAYELKFHRHPDQPKRPLSAIDLHFMEQKEEVLKYDPKLPLKVVKEILAERFANLNNEQKAMYKEKVLKSMEEYWLNLEMFCKEHPECKNEGLLLEVAKMKRLPAAKTLFKSSSEDVTTSINVEVQQPATADKSGLKENAKKLMEEYCLNLEKLMMDHPECDDSSLRRELRRVIERKNVSISTCLPAESTRKDEICTVDSGVKRPATEDESEMNQMSKKGRSVSEEMKNSTEPKVAVKSNPAELKQKKNKKSSVKKVVATIEVNVEKKAPKQAGGLKQKKKMKRAPSALKVE